MVVARSVVVQLLSRLEDLGLGGDRQLLVLDHGQQAVGVLAQLCVDAALPLLEIVARGVEVLHFVVSVVGCHAVDLREIVVQVVPLKRLKGRSGAACASAE